MRKLAYRPCRQLTARATFLFCILPITTWAHGESDLAASQRLVLVTAQESGLRIAYVISPGSEEMAKLAARFDQNHDRQIDPSEAAKLGSFLVDELATRLVSELDDSRIVLSFRVLEVTETPDSRPAHKLHVRAAATLPVSDHRIHTVRLTEAAAQGVDEEETTEVRQHGSAKIIGAWMGSEDSLWSRQFHRHRDQQQPETTTLSIRFTCFSPGNHQISEPDRPWILAALVFLLLAFFSFLTVSRTKPNRTQ